MQPARPHSLHRKRTHVTRLRCQSRPPGCSATTTMEHCRGQNNDDGALPWSEQRRWSIAVVVQGRRMGSAGNDGAGVTNGTGTAAGRRPTPPAGPTRPTAHQRLTRPCPRRRLGSHSRRPYLTRFRRGGDVCPAWRLETRRTATAQQSVPFIPADTREYLKFTASGKAESRQESTLDVSSRRIHTQNVPFPAKGRQRASY